MPDQPATPTPELRTNSSPASLQENLNHRTEAAESSRNNLRQQNLGEFIRSAISEAQRIANRAAYE